MRIYFHLISLMQYLKKYIIQIRKKQEESYGKIRQNPIKVTYKKVGVKRKNKKSIVKRKKLV